MSGTTGAVVITGCSSGIGRAVARRLATEGHVVYATARDVGSIDDLAKVGCKTLQLDVTDAQSAARAIAAIEAAEGSVAVLVNNAGFGQSGAVEAVSVDAMRAQFETNVPGSPVGCAGGGAFDAAGLAAGYGSCRGTAGAISQSGQGGP